MGGVRSAYGREKRFIQGFGGRNLKERDHLEDPGIEGRIVLRCMFKKLDGGIDWIDLARDRDRLL